MPFNGSGTFNLPTGNPVVVDTTIDAAVHNNTNNEIATALSNCVTRDGQSPLTSSLPMAGFKLTGLGAGSGNGESVRYEQVGALATAQLTTTVTFKTSATGSSLLAVGTTAERDVTPAVGHIRSNSDTGETEAWNGTQWVLDVHKTSTTGSAIIPSGTTAQRDVSPSASYLRYNTSLSQFEGYGASGWGEIGGGAKGGGTDKVFYENDHLITTNYTIGQETLISGATITIATPAVVTLTAHGFIAGQMVFFQTTGALPTGLSVDTGYYIISTGLTANAFQLSLTDGGAAINTTGTQSGVHSCGKIKNAMTAGDTSVAAGVTITVPTGSSWSLI